MIVKYDHFKGSSTVKFIPIFEKYFFLKIDFEYANPKFEIILKDILNYAYTGITAYFVTVKKDLTTEVQNFNSLCFQTYFME